MWTTDTEEKARAIIRDLTSLGLKLATAESCTGGLIAGRLDGDRRLVLRRRPRLRHLFQEAKVEMLGVNPATACRTWRRLA